MKITELIKIEYSLVIIKNKYEEYQMNNALAQCIKSPANSAEPIPLDMWKDKETGHVIKLCLMSDPWIESYVARGYKIFQFKEIELNVDNPAAMVRAHKLKHGTKSIQDDAKKHFLAEVKELNDSLQDVDKYMSPREAYALYKTLEYYEGVIKEMGLEQDGK